MNAVQIRAKILEDIANLKGAKLPYISGRNHISRVKVDAAGNRITAIRGDNENISITLETLDVVARALASHDSISIDAVLQGSGNARSALETILVHLPNVGYLPENKPPNTGPKKIVWVDNEIHPAGQVFDACQFLLENSAESAGSESPDEVDRVSAATSRFFDECNRASLIVRRNDSLRLISSLLSKRFLIATGLSGSGKSKLAQAFARWITPARLVADIFSSGSEIKSEKVTYYVKRSDTLSVEFWNSANEAEATRVVLPREMIDEWANYIRSNSTPSSTQARSLREAVKRSSKFSDQLHSFETHLKAAAFALVNNPPQGVAGRCYEILAVGSDWTGNENILGYPDGLQPTHYVAKAALDLILHAEAHGDVPHFLILDEMNLSHVERYFADVLSIIESDEGLELYSGDMKKPETWRKTSAGKPVPPKLKQLPENLFIIGTVNVDETTYMFSPKVLDRANVIEFRMDAGELSSFLRNPAKPDIEKLDGAGTAFGRAFVNAAKSSVNVPGEIASRFQKEMLLLFKVLQSANAEFGYRVAHEAARFMYFYKEFGAFPPEDTEWFDDAMDAVIVQKLLPKLHGSRGKLEGLLWALAMVCGAERAGGDEFFLKECLAASKCEDEAKFSPEAVLKSLESAEPKRKARYAASFDKILRMYRKLIRDQFVTFAEA